MGAAEGGEPAVKVSRSRSRVVQSSQVSGVVLGVGVVVAALAAAELVAGGEHDRAARGEEGGEEGADVEGSCREYRGVVGRPFGAVVPGEVLAVAVAVVLAVGLVVLVAVGDEVGER